MIIQSRFGATQSNLGYQFFDAAGTLLGIRITAGIVVGPEAGSYLANATVHVGAVGVYWNDTVTLATATEDLREALAIGALGGLAGSGAYAITVTVTDGTDPLQGAIVRVSNGATHLYGTTDAAGQATFALDAATYSIGITCPGFQFTPTTRTVTGNQAGTLTTDLEMAARTVPNAPSSPDLTVVFIDVQDITGVVQEGEEITFIPYQHPVATDEYIVLSSEIKTATTDVSGRASIELQTGIAYKAVNVAIFGANGHFFTPTGETYNLATDL